MIKHRKIWLGALVVLLPFIIVFVLLFILQVDRRFQYYFAWKNCMSQTGLMYDRLHYNEKPVDVAFFGTSHTIDAVCDYCIEDSLRKSGMHMNVFNLGYCRLGRNMIYSLVKETVKQKKPKYIVIEVTERENRDGHMDVAYIADAADVWMPVLIFNDNYFQDIFKATVVRFEAVKQKMLGQYTPPPINMNEFGHHKDTSVTDPSIMQYQKDNHLKNYKYSSGFSRWFYNQASFSNLEKAVALAEANSIKVLFVYLPQYASIHQPEEIEFYSSIGQVLIPPDSIYQDPHNWKDINHMNEYGATAMAGWLSAELQQLQ